MLDYLVSRKNCQISLLSDCDEFEACIYDETIHQSKYEKVRELGAGAFATVYLGIILLTL